MKLSKWFYMMSGWALATAFMCALSGSIMYIPMILAAIVDYYLAGYLEKGEKENNRV